MWGISSNYLQSDETIEYIDSPSKWSLSCILSYIWVGIMGITSIGMIAASISLGKASIAILGSTYVVIALLSSFSEIPQVVSN